MPEYVFNPDDYFPSGEIDFKRSQPASPYDRIPSGETDLDMILDMLKPRNYQQATKFEGGMHFGPSRHAYIPPENIAAASQALQMIQGTELRGLELEKMKRAESVLAKLSEGTTDAAGNKVYPGLGELSAGDQLALAAGGVFGGGRSSRGGYSGGYSGMSLPGMGGGSSSGGYGMSKPHELSKAKTEAQQAADERIGMIHDMMLAQGANSIEEMPPHIQKAYMEAWGVSQGGGGGDGELPPAEGGYHDPSGNRSRTFWENHPEHTQPTEAAPQVTNPDFAQGGGYMTMPDGTVVKIGGGGGYEQPIGPAGSNPLVDNLMTAPATGPQPGPAPAASPVEAPPEMTGEEYMRTKTAGQSPFTESPEAIAGRQGSLGDEIGWWGDAIGAGVEKMDAWQEKMALFRQGYDPETGLRITPDDPRFAQLSPWAQSRIKGEIEMEGRRVAQARALGYPTYGYEG